VAVASGASDLAEPRGALAEALRQANRRLGRYCSTRGAGQRLIAVRVLNKALVQFVVRLAEPK
jgi:hypothetical protein